MNLVIDQGNSSAKIALFEGDALVKVFHTEALSEGLLFEIIREFRPKAGILCSVKEQFQRPVIPRLTRDLLKKNADCQEIAGQARNDNQCQKTFETVPFFELNYQLPLPLTLNYQTPETLGMDRIAAAVGAAAQKPATPLLIIDIGTAITIDYVSAEGVYNGGNISPGVDLRFKALHQFTGRLPLVNEKGDIPPLGYDTETAIRSGVIKGIIRELDSYIDEYKKKYNIFTFLTGGHAFYFESKLKNAIFADGNLVLKGLNAILIYQQK
jgi:type III pantothenate kinase